MDLLNFADEEEEDEDDAGNLHEIFLGAEEEEEQAAAIVTACCGAYSSEKEFLGPKLNTGGRSKGAQSLNRGICTWYDDYLSPNPIYPPRMFREVLRIPIKLYNYLA